MAETFTFFTLEHLLYLMSLFFLCEGLFFHDMGLSNMHLKIFIKRAGFRGSDPFTFVFLDLDYHGEKTPLTSAIVGPTKSNELPAESFQWLNC